jgi:hypothetical protein
MPSSTRSSKRAAEKMSAEQTKDEVKSVKTPKLDSASLMATVDQVLREKGLVFEEVLKDAELFADEEEEEEENGGVALSGEEMDGGMSVSGEVVEEDGGVSVLGEEGSGGEEEDDEDEDYVDLEGEALEQYLRRARKADIGREGRVVEESDEEGEEENGRTVTRRSVKTTRQSLFDPDSYTALDLGPSALPEWYRDLPEEEKIAARTRAKADYTNYFEKAKAQAKSWTRANCRRECPYAISILHVMQIASAEELAKFVLTGMDEYGQYLAGLGRVPTTEEIKAIPRPTREQLRQSGLYTDLIRKGLSEYRYGGSNTSKGGMGDRARDYELAKRKAANAEAPEMLTLNHLNVLLQKDSEAFWRLRASWPRAVATPVLVLIAEAAMIDYERTLSDDVPTPDHKEWSKIHSTEMLAASQQRFPSGRDSDRDFVGLNRASPYKQGVRIGARQHRLRMFEEADMTCSCCLHVIERSATYIEEQCRLSGEIGFCHEGITTVCLPCRMLWYTERAKAMTAEEFVDYRRDIRANLISAADVIVIPSVTHCVTCEKPFNDEGSQVCGLRTFNPDGLDWSVRCCQACGAILRRDKGYRLWDEEQEREWCSDRRKHVAASVDWLR